MVALLAAEAAPHGTGPVLTAPAMLLLQFSIGWSNDARDANRDAAAGRTDKPVAAGDIGTGAVWAAACLAVAGALAMSLAISVATFVITAVMAAAGWAYNAGLKSTLASGLMYLAGFGLLPAYAASTLPGQPWPRWQVTAAAALVGFGGHFANVLPDLAGDRATGVRGLPQRVAARRGVGGVRGCALASLLAASVLLLVAASPARRWVAVAGLAVSALLAVIGGRGAGRLPFVAAFCIAAIDVILFVVGGDALT